MGPEAEHSLKTNSIGVHPFGPTALENIKKNEGNKRN